MTTVTMVWIQNHANEVRNANKAVLSYLAFRAHYDNGLAAWPAMGTIADACGISVKTVQRSIDWLVENGWLEPGQQDYSGIDPVTGEPIRRDRRTVVWNVICKDSSLPSEPVTEEPANRESVRSILARARKIKDKMSPRDGTAEEPTGGVDKMSEKTDKMSPNIHRYTNNPSVPTGHLPASGESSPADEDDSKARTTDVETEPAAPMPDPGEPDLPGEVLDALDQMLSLIHI